MIVIRMFTDRHICYQSRNKPFSWFWMLENYHYHYCVIITLYWIQYDRYTIFTIVYYTILYLHYSILTDILSSPKHTNLNHQLRSAYIEEQNFCIVREKKFILISWCLILLIFQFFQNLRIFYFKLIFF